MQNYLSSSRMGASGDDSHMDSFLAGNPSDIQTKNWLLNMRASKGQKRRAPVKENFRIGATKMKLPRPVRGGIVDQLQQMKKRRGGGGGRVKMVGVCNLRPSKNKRMRKGGQIGDDIMNVVRMAKNFKHVYGDQVGSKFSHFLGHGLGGRRGSGFGSIFRSIAKTGMKTILKPALKGAVSGAMENIAMPALAQKLGVGSGLRPVKFKGAGGAIGAAKRRGFPVPEGYSKAQEAGVDEDAPPPYSSGRKPPPRPPPPRHRGPPPSYEEAMSPGRNTRLFPEDQEKKNKRDDKFRREAARNRRELVQLKRLMRQQQQQQQSSQQSNSRPRNSGFLGDIDDFLSTPSGKMINDMAIKPIASAAHGYVKNKVKGFQSGPKPKGKFGRFAHSAVNNPVVQAVGNSANNVGESFANAIFDKKARQQAPSRRRGIPTNKSSRPIPAPRRPVPAPRRSRMETSV